MEDESELLALRRARLETWRGMGIDPFGGPFPGAETCRHVIENYADERPARVAGRLISKREMGKNVFAHIQDETGKLQVYAQVQGLGEKFGLWKLLDIGDFIGGEGTLFTTKTGEKTVRLSDLRILAKSLRPIPSQWYGLADVEQRYRQRYVDLIVSEEARKVLLLRSRIVSEVRRFFEERGFTEVETPMMQTIAGGAAARPFVTKHNALGIDLYMRIAPELYLKRLLVGGFTKVFEINRNFRNEGVSRRHNPEFTMLEAYWAYADFEAMAQLVEDLIATVAQKVMGTLKVGGHPAGEDGSAAAEPIDLTPPWPRKPYRDLVRAAAGDDWFSIGAEQRRERCAKLGVEISPALEDFEVTNQVFEKLVEAKIRNPVFVTHLPKELVPLAKQNQDDPSVVDVFELIIGGHEVSPGYSELNDPVVQRQRLAEQAGEEQQKLDEDFLTALEYGMPPAGGIGIGIDRLVMTLTGAASIRDVILFPLLKPRSLG
ncbi:MAG TPA: lysine--tRNA ligase [Candidatus Methylacidiphilales bacterium]|nr:lysine--tRNA ligase [Candidatus Methylacidiphilales bacterium]